MKRLIAALLCLGLAAWVGGAMDVPGLSLQTPAYAWGASGDGLDDDMESFDDGDVDDAGESDDDGGDDDGGSDGED